MLKEILEKLNLPPARYECERFGSDHLPVFVMKIEFEDRLINHTMYSYQAYKKKKEIEKDVSLHVIRHLGKYYDIIVKDVNAKKMLEPRYEIKDIKKTNEVLWKCYIKTIKVLNELKEKMKKKEIVEEFDFRSSAIRDRLSSCGCHV